MTKKRNPIRKHKKTRTKRKYVGGNPKFDNLMNVFKRTEGEWSKNKVEYEKNIINAIDTNYTNKEILTYFYVENHKKKNLLVKVCEYNLDTLALKLINEFKKTDFDPKDKDQLESLSIAFFYAFQSAMGSMTQSMTNVAMKLIEVLEPKQLLEAFQNACYYNMEDVAIKIIDKKLELEPTSDLKKMFEIACQHMNKQVALVLLDKIKPEDLVTKDSQNKTTNTALILACSQPFDMVTIYEKQKMEKVALEIMNKMKPDDFGCVTDKRTTALIWACYNHMHTVATKLIESGQSNPEYIGLEPNASTIYNKNTITALILACHGGKPNIAMKLIEEMEKKKDLKDNPFETVDKEKKTALIHACMYKLGDVALALIKTGHSNPEAIDYTNDTALSITCKNNLEGEMEGKKVKVKDELIKEINKSPGKQIACPKSYVLNIPFEPEPANIIPSSENPEENKYIIHNKEYNGINYPIITILKGTILFTCRYMEENTQNPLTSAMHLYKIDESYVKENEEINFENSRTYFYPLPYYAEVVGDFNTVDLVVLTEDIRLLCMVSPSPISRGIRHGNKKGLTNCREKNKTYDLCISMDVMKGLNIQGYIGMAYQDSLTNHSSIMNKFLKKSIYIIIYKYLIFFIY